MLLINGLAAIPDKFHKGATDKTSNDQFLFLFMILRITSQSQLCPNSHHTLFFFYKNVVFPAQAEYSYFSADFRLKIFLCYS